MKGVGELSRGDGREKQGEVRGKGNWGISHGAGRRKQAERKKRMEMGMES